MKNVLLEKIQILLQYILPKQWITHLISYGASWKGGWITHCAITLFVRIYKINLKECSNPNLNDYATFNDFFTRKLNIHARPIDPHPSTLIIPADGIISQIGKINNTHIFKIKNSTYNLDALLAGHDNLINYFKNGSFSVIYIPPYSCHRIYMPCTGTLREVLYIPGELFSVHPLIINNIPNILSRNEKIICLFDTDFGHIAQILIGSIIVGSIVTSWNGTITPPRTGIVKHWHYPSSSSRDNCTNTIQNNSIILSKGEEMGMFKLGSTVITLFNEKQILLNTQLKSGDIVQIGTPLAQGHNS